MKLAPNIGLLILRVTSSALMITHGIPKLEKLLAGGEIKFADPLGFGMTATLILAIIAEIIAPVFIILGYKTRIASFFPAFTMFVAAFIVHASDPLGRKEAAILYLCAFTVLIFTGAGRYSFDNRTS